MYFSRWSRRAVAQHFARMGRNGRQRRTYTALLADSHARLTWEELTTFFLFGSAGFFFMFLVGEANIFWYNYETHIDDEFYTLWKTLRDPIKRDAFLRQKRYEKLGLGELPEATAEEAAFAKRVEGVSVRVDAQAAFEGIDIIPIVPGESEMAAMAQELGSKGEGQILIAALGEDGVANALYGKSDAAKVAQAVRAVWAARVKAGLTAVPAPGDVPLEARLSAQQLNALANIDPAHSIVESLAANYNVAAGSGGVAPELQGAVDAALPAMSKVYEAVKKGSDGLAESIEKLPEWRQHWEKQRSEFLTGRPAAIVAWNQDTQKAEVRDAESVGDAMFALSAVAGTLGTDVFSRTGALILGGPGVDHDYAKTFSKAVDASSGIKLE